MSNPYLANFNPSNYGLTIFRPDTILTAEQLNILFGFLLSQEQLTRTQLIGVGVVCGLKPTLNKSTGMITITTGYGVTTDGDLLQLELRKYTHFADYRLTDHLKYEPFQKLFSPDLPPAEQKLWEIFTDDDPLLPSTALELATITAELDDKVVVLYLESEAKSADTCTGVACDSKGQRLQNRLRLLLVNKEQAKQLISEGLRQAALARTELPVLSLPRIHPANFFDVSFRPRLSRIASDVNSALNDASDLVQKIDDVPLLNRTKLKNILANLNKDPRGRLATDQYIYDWLKDLADAYNEFRESTADWLVQCMPVNDPFPKHLLLGELTIETTCKSDYRHWWQRSTAVATPSDTRQRAIFYYNRIGKMIELFRLFSSGNDPKDDPELLKKDTIEITPDPYRAAPIDRRSIPFYYYPISLRPFWSYERKIYCEQKHIQSYFRPKTGVDEVQNPFDYQIETYPFYRIEGLLGQPVSAVLKRILELRADYNLGFDVVALRTDDRQRLITNNFDYTDLAVDFRDNLDLFNTLSMVKQEEGTLYLTLDMTQKEFHETLEKCKLRLKDQNTIKESLGRLSALQHLKDTYENRKTAFEASQTFAGFLREHPGLEHGTGVSKGGTFIVVYSNPERVTNKDDTVTIGGDSVVVADFYLPYYCGDKGNVVQFVLPEPPPTLEVKKTFCQKAKPEGFTENEEIIVSPAGGDFTVTKVGSTERLEMVFPQDGKSYFYPKEVGSFKIIYTVPGRSPVFEEVEVSPTTSITELLFEKTGTTGAGKVKFKAPDASFYTIKFGDEAEENPKLKKVSIPKGRLQTIIDHPYELATDGSGEFLIELTVFDTCSSVSKTERVVFSRIPPTVLTVEPTVVCFNKSEPQQASGFPKNGTFSSSPNGLGINKDNGTWFPQTSGPFEITYTANNSSDTKKIYVLPDDFAITIESGGNGKPTNFSILILPPPSHLKYVWSFGTNRARLTALPEPQEKIEGKDTIYYFENVTIGPNHSILVEIADRNDTSKKIACFQKIKQFPAN